MNKQQGYVPITLDGKKLKLRFDSNALADAEEIIGRSTFQLLSEPERIGFSELRALVFCGLPQQLRAKHALRSHRDVGAHLSFGNMAETAQAVIEAIRLSMPEEMQDASMQNADDEVEGEAIVLEQLEGESPLG